MELKSTIRWIVPGLLVIGSPIFSIPFFFLVMITVSAIPVPESLELWLETGPFRRAIGTAFVTGVFSIDSLLRSFYITLPLLLVSALGLQSMDDDYQSMPRRILMPILGMGILYVVLYFSGVYFGWLEEVFYT
jgi:hypothetical protein